MSFIRSAFRYGSGSPNSSRDRSAPKQSSKAETGSLCDDNESHALPPLDLQDFIAWLQQYGRLGGLTKRELWLEYGEFCLYTNTEQLTEGRFLRRIGAAGIERYRETTGARRWLYRLRKTEVLHLKIASR